MGTDNNREEIIKGYANEAEEALINVANFVEGLGPVDFDLPTKTDYTQLRLRVEHAERMADEYRRVLQAA